MKLMSKVVKQIKDSCTTEKSVLCEYVSTPSGMIKLSTPILCCEKECGWCLGKEHYTPYVQPKESSARTWLCANPLCEVYSSKTQVKEYLPTSNNSNSLEWALFCEMNGIGDIHHGIRFEDLQQDTKKVSYILKFATTPRGILFMQGTQGTGKTFAAMAICELFIRKHTSCVFTTQTQMCSRWLETFKSEKYDDYVERISRVKLLVIDDFGLSEPPPKFLNMFMDLINTRMNWTDRGTVITTNLSTDDFLKYCGAPLFDRIQTGMVFIYTGKSKRKKNIL